MRNQTRVITAVAVVAALAAGSTAAAVASTASGKPGIAAATTASASGKCAPSDLAAQLGVSQGSLDQAGRTVKMSLRTGSGTVTGERFAAVLAQALGIPQARVQQALAADKSCGPAPGGSAPGAKSDGSKHAPSPAAERQAQHAMAAAVAKELHVSLAEVNAALRPLFAAGHADTSSADFAAAARALGVSTQQLATALMHAKQSLAGQLARS
jgi:hypothetical protein